MENCPHDMCHIALLLPLLALPVLWIWPLAVSVPVYAMVAIVSAAIYWYAILAMRRPVETGAEGIIGAIAEVVESCGTRLVVRIGSELWNARSLATLQEGDHVQVVAVERLILTVKALDALAATYHNAQPSPPGSQAATT
jgi:membrane protein implicated in regulation of membrane protease activity